MLRTLPLQPLPRPSPPRRHLAHAVTVGLWLGVCLASLAPHRPIHFAATGGSAPTLTRGFLSQPTGPNIAPIAGSTHSNDDLHPTSPPSGPAPLRHLLTPTAMAVTAGLLAAGPAFAASGTIDLLTAFGAPVFTIIELLFLGRLILSWLPEVNERKMPWLLVYYPTEVFCRPIRKVLPPIFEVDSAPIFWLMLFSFGNELLFGGKEGLLTLLARQQAEIGP